jgi:hypothetical protein
MPKAEIDWLESFGQKDGSNRFDRYLLRPGLISYASHYISKFWHLNSRRWKAVKGKGAVKVFGKFPMAQD